MTLNGRDAEEVAQSLARERLRVTDHIAALQRDFDGVVEASESSNADDEHDPEGATIAFERAQIAAMLANSKARLDAVDRAIERLDRGTYGRCDVCGEDIAAERLTARPTATTCVRCMS
ncbi:MAG TPA: TraR/DksA C4-type zinc finger protein [Mycobacteriales bacterium]